MISSQLIEINHVLHTTTLMAHKTILCIAFTIVQPIEVGL